MVGGPRMPHQSPAAQPAEKAAASLSCLGKENNPSLACVPDFTRSKIPVATKSRPVPDFKKLHESWKAKFHKGKAVSKKSCTRPCPFSLTQKGERFQVLPSAELVTSNPLDSYSEVLPPEQPPTAGPQALHAGGPLKEIRFGQNNAKNTAPKKPAPENGPVGQDFRADPKALATILNNVGLPSAHAPGAKHSLPLRVPIQTGRMSAYGAPTQRPNLALGPMPRPSILAEQAYVGAERRGPGRGPSSLSVVSQDLEPITKKTQLHQTDAALQATEGSRSGDHVKNGAYPSNHGTATGAKAAPTGPQSAADESSCHNPATVPLSITSHIDAELLQDTDKRQTSKADVGPTAADFVSDPSALASILSNTGLNSNTLGKGGKLSMAQRVPVRGKGANSLYSIGSSRAGGLSVCPPRASFAPRVDFSRMSWVPNLGCLDIDVKCTPHQANRHGSSSQPEAVRPSPLTSAGRVPDKNPYSAHFRSLQKKRHLIFPKTPQALALEAANKLQNAEAAAASNLVPTTQESSSHLKWSDGLSPQSASQNTLETPEDEAAVPLEKVAVRLFLDTEPYNTCQDLDGDSEKAKALILKDMAHLQHIENLSKQLQQEMAAYASRLFPDLPIPNDRSVIPNSTEALAASKDLSHLDGTICNQLFSVDMSEPPSTTAHLQNFPVVTQKGPKCLGASGVEPQPPRASVCEFSLSEPKPPHNVPPFLHTSRTGMVPSVHTAFRSIPTHSSHPGVILQDHSLSCIPGNTNTDYKPFICTSGSLNTEQKPFPGSISEPHLDTPNTVHHPLPCVPVTINTEPCHLLGSCTETAETSSLLGASGAEHHSLPLSSSTEHQVCLPSAFVPGLIGSGNVLKMSTTPTFSSQGSICSNLPIQLSKVPAGSAVALGAPWVRPDVPRPSLKQMFQHIMVSFQEVCLDDECCFYTSKPAAPCPDATLRSETSCKNPLATMLELEEAMHFSPIKSPKI
ncbi:tastin [Pleurodeles waltl]|uniref:tastin n=1 Tax=Pleurodeles waltl TaxID=8319 RepID=UPI00370962D2